MRASAGVQLTREPAIEISGPSGVPLMLAMAQRRDWSGHVPGPNGLPGGYPVRLKDGHVELDLPAALTRDEAIAWNLRYEEESGLVVTRGRPRGLHRHFARAAASVQSGTCRRISCPRHRRCLPRT